MTQDKVAEVRGKMSQALSLIKEAVDLSIPLVQSDGREEMKLLWEDFIREFIRYTRHESKQTGTDLISLVSLARILK